MSVCLATIGFTKKPLSAFVSLLQSAGVTKVVDTRLRPNSQLSGFAKSDDLSFILSQFGIGYTHCPTLAPSDELLRQYRSDHDWPKYEQRYRELIRERAALDALEKEMSDGHAVCLLCSEHSATKCHRRVLAEMYESEHPGCAVVHLQ